MDYSSQLKTNSEATDSTKKIPMPSGKLENITVYKIPISLLKYNIHNGRIGSWVQEQENNNIDISKMSQQDLNKSIESAIKESNISSYNDTKKHMSIWGQTLPGVVLSNGTVIDGNRRFTCIRELARETQESKYNYFEAAILDVDKTTPKYLKEMEWHLQLGIEERVNYDPIEILLDIYHYIVEKKEFTIEEYSKHTNIDIKRAKDKLDESLLLKDYLEHIKSSKKWFIAKEEKIQGPLEEIRKILNRFKYNDEEKNQIKEILFDYLVAHATPTKDIGKYIRKIGEYISKSNINDKKQFMKNHINGNNKIQKLLSQNNDIKDILQEIQNDYQLKEYMIKNVKDLHFQNYKSSIINLPIKLLEEFIKNLDVDINDELLLNLDINENKEFFNLMDDIIKRFEKIQIAHKNRYE